MSNTTNKKTTTKSTTKKTTTKATSKPKTTKANDEIEALKAELQAKIALLDEKLAKVEAEPMREPNVEIVEQNTGENVAFEEPNPNKKTKVYSMVFGLFSIHCPSRGFTNFKEYGNFKILSYAQLVDYMLTCSESFKQGRLYISDPQIVEALGLTEYYEDLFSMSFVKDILDGKADIKTVGKVIEASNEKQKQSLGNYIAILGYEDKFTDYNMINELAKATGVDIIRKINEMKEFAANAEGTAE